MRFLLLLLLWCGLWPASAGAQGWYSTSWQYRKKITIDRTKVGATLTSFPLLVSWTDADLASRARADGNDIVFTASNGTTKLDHEIERYVSATGETVAWVRVPSLSSTVDTELYLYYANAAATSQQNRTGVWDAGFKGVWHLKESPSGASGEMQDATANANAGTTVGMTAGNQTSGRIGGAVSQGVTTAINAPSSVSAEISGSITVSLWVHATNATNGPYWVDYRGPGETPPENRLYGVGLAYDGTAIDSKLFFEWENAAGVNTVVRSSVAPSSTTGSWVHYSYVRDVAAKTVSFYANGVQLGTSVAYANNASGGGTATLAIGPGGRGVGVFDEVRISNVIRSTGWIATEYNNQSSPATFYSVGAEEEARPMLTLAASVAPAGAKLPGADLTYGMTFTNIGGRDGASVIVSDRLPGNTDFKVGSTTFNAGTTGTTAVVSYSSDGGTNWSYAPSSGGGGAPTGYDRSVTNIRWTLSGTLGATAPNNSGSVGFMVRIR